MTQLNEKNLYQVFTYLNPRKKEAIKLKYLHSGLKPHIFRLKLKHGEEKDTLERIISELGQQLA